MKKNLILIILTLFLGCSQKPYSKIQDRSEIGAKISSFSILKNDPTIEKLIKSALQIKIQKNSIYKIKYSFLYYTKKCNNPLASSKNRSYDGYVRITLLKNRKNIYIIQKDFKGKIDKDLIDDLIELMIDEMKFILLRQIDE